MGSVTLLVMCWSLAVSVNGREGMLQSRLEQMHCLAACRLAAMHLVGGGGVFALLVFGLAGKCRGSGGSR